MEGAERRTQLGEEGRAQVPDTGVVLAVCLLAFNGIPL